MSNDCRRRWRLYYIGLMTFWALLLIGLGIALSPEVLAQRAIHPEVLRMTLDELGRRVEKLEAWRESTAPVVEYIRWVQWGFNKALVALGCAIATAAGKEIWIHLRERKRKEE